MSPPRRRTWFTLGVPNIILLLGLSFTCLATWALARTIRNLDQARFELVTATKTRAVEERLNLYASLVRAEAALFSSGLPITREQFAGFVARQRLHLNDAGVVRLGWIVRVPESVAEHFLAWARREVDPAYHFWPDHPGDRYAITYIAPETPQLRAVLGLDPTTDAMRGAALETALRTGTATLIAPFPLISNQADVAAHLRGEDKPKIDFGLYFPAYDGEAVPATEAERRAEILGVASIGIKGESFLNLVFEGQPLMTHIELFDGESDGPKTRISVRGENAAGYSPRIVRWMRIQRHNRVWSLRFESRPEFEAGSSRGIIPYAAAAGVWGSILLFALGRRQALLSRRKEELARDLAASREDLLEHNNNLEGLVESRTRVAEERAAQLRELAGELINAEQRERSRIAAVLHDDLQQVLVAAKMRVTALETSGAKEEALAAKELISQAIQTARSLSTQLDPQIIQERGLIGGLEWAARKARENHGLEVTIDLDPAAIAASFELNMFLFRAVGEVLLNIVKHAGAKNAEIYSRALGDGFLEVIVRDHGKGCEDAAPAEASPDQFGLVSIKRRLELFGGRLEMEAAEEGRGCVVRLVAPMEVNPKPPNADNKPAEADNKPADEGKA